MDEDRRGLFFRERCWCQRMLGAMILLGSLRREESESNREPKAHPPTIVNDSTHKSSGLCVGEHIRVMMEVQGSS